MGKSEPPQDLAARVERQRRELGQRLDLSPKLRQLSRAAVPPALLPEQLRRSPSLTRAVVFGAIALLAACVIGTTALAASGLWLQGQLGDPATTAENFYGALHEQDYSRAYSDLSSGAQKQLSPSDFAAQYANLDAVAGVVESYSVSARVSSATATVVASVVRRGDLTRAQQQSLTLLKQNGGWRIDQIAVGDSSPVQP
jgi:hypothetical protein